MNETVSNPLFSDGSGQTTANGLCLRPYQVEAVKGIEDAFLQAPSTLLVMATGTGKTVVIAEVLRRRAHLGRAMVIAHRGELVFQGTDTIQTVADLSVDIEMAEYRAPTTGSDRADVVVGTVQTQNAGTDLKRMERFNPAEFATLVIDEAHHSPAASYLEVVNYYRQNPELRVLGVTATPDRHDEEAMGQVFETVAYEYGIEDAIKDGYLVPIQQSPILIHGLDYSHVRTTAGDLNGSDLAGVMESEEPAQQIVQATLERAMSLKPGTLTETVKAGPIEELPARMAPILAEHPPRQTLVFCVTVAHANLFAEVANRWSPDLSKMICGKTPKDDRREILKSFGARKFPILANVGVATEGFDAPGIEVVAMARPTKSRSLYTQMVGRGTRTLPGVIDDLETPEERREAIALSPKPAMEVIDFVGNSGRHKLVTARDVLAGNQSDAVVERANRNMERDAEEGREPEDVQESLREAEQEIIEERRREEEAERERRKKLVATTSYEVGNQVNPFDLFDVEPWRERPWHRGRKPSEAMSKMLVNAGIDPTDKSFTEAKQLIGQIIDRRDKGKCTYKQARALVRAGISEREAGAMTFTDASVKLDEIMHRTPASEKQLRALARFGYRGDYTKAEASRLLDQLAKNGWKRLPDHTAPEPEPTYDEEEVPF